MRAALLASLRPCIPSLGRPLFQNPTVCLLLRRQFHHNGPRLSMKLKNGRGGAAKQSKNTQKTRHRHGAFVHVSTVGNKPVQGKKHSHKGKTKSSAQARSPIANGPIITKDYIEKDIGLPVQGEYPNAPEELLNMIELDTRVLKQTSLKKLFKSQLQVGEIRVTENKGNRENPLRTQLSTRTYDDKRIVVYGDGKTERESWYHCFLHLIARLHKEHYLMDFYKPTIPCLNRALQSDPKVAVFEYAARFLLVPTITSKPIDPEIKKTVLRQGKIASFANFQSTIELPELGISAVGVGKTPYIAGVAASTRFLELVKERGKDGATDDQSLQKAKFLDTSIMPSFRNFWPRMRGQLTVRYEPFNEPNGDRQLYVGTATIDDRSSEQIMSQDSKTAENLALLTLLVTIGKERPQILSSFETALQQEGGKVMVPISPVMIDMSNEVATTMADATIIGRSVPRSAEQSTMHDRTESPVRPIRRYGNHTRRNQALQEAIETYQASPNTETIRRKREELPINQYRAEILDMVTGNAFTVVVGATGSGKTTQVPQMFLEAASKAGKGAACNVICTQPRRIAATSVARRVADERAEKVGDAVGFIVRGAGQPPRSDGSILFCTAGTLLQQLKSNAEHVFDTTSHILLDEVHERDSILDYLLIVLKQTLKDRVASNKPVPKIVLMSATMNTELFSKYFGATGGDGKIIPCPSINVPGRLFPVKNRYLREIEEGLKSAFGRDEQMLSKLFSETDTDKYLHRELRPESLESGSKAASDEYNYDPDDSLVPIGLVAATVAHVAKTTSEGAILVFLPGQQEILATQLLLTRNRILDVDFKDQSRYKLFVLHSSTSAEDQASVFEPVPEGCRKIILSTNIAETSVTIPDVQHVVDSGKHREIQYNPIDRITALKTAWISKANARQRAGRAGRVQNGNYYGLYTEERLERMKVSSTAELLRSDLESICLDVKAQGFGDSVEEFLSKAIEPPSPTNIRSALAGLRSLEAITQTEELTPLGRLLSTLPVQPALGKMIVLGIIFRCLDSCIILGALSESRNIFMKPSGSRSAWKESHKRWLGNSQSEHIAQIRAFKYLRQYSEQHSPEATRRHAYEEFLSVAAFDQIQRTIADIENILVQNQLIPPSAKYRNRVASYGQVDQLNDRSGNLQLIKALALVGLAPNLAVPYRRRWFRTATSDNVLVHPKSILVDKRGDVDCVGAAVTFTTLAGGDDGALSMREVTEVPPTTALMFGGRVDKVGSWGDLLQIRGWLKFGLGSRQDATLVFKFRQVLDHVLSNAFQEMATRSQQSRSSSREFRSIQAPLQPQEESETSRLREEFTREVVAVLDLVEHRSMRRPRDVQPSETSPTSRAPQRPDAPRQSGLRQRSRSAGPQSLRQMGTKLFDE
ncbi:unnamed protein product [Periconia digitata]|uniref:RNA helicase n=1 Tax=Periconia digitata TaxID=1303443 RepID=A0A9W4XLV6_9PLEO|nr:unnamed protein product [Periconia digitata]